MRPKHDISITSTLMSKKYMCDVCFTHLIYLKIIIKIVSAIKALELRSEIYRIPP